MTEFRKWLSNLIYPNKDRYKEMFNLLDQWYDKASETSVKAELRKSEGDYSRYAGNRVHTKVLRRCAQQLTEALGRSLK